MGNCLKTQLKDAVVNQSLQRINEFKFTVLRQSENPRLMLEIRGINSLPIRCTNEGYFATTEEGLLNPESRLTSYTVPANTTQVLYFSNTNYYVFIDNKFDIRTLNIQTVNGSLANNIELDIIEYKYLVDLEKISVPSSCKGDMSFLSNFVNLQVINLYGEDIYGVYNPSNCICSWINIGGNITGNISNFSNIYLSRLAISSSRFSGQLDSLGTSIYLNTLYTAPDIIGSIESLAASMVTNGRTSGSLLIIGNGKITYNSEIFSGNKTITFDSSLPNGYSIA